MTSCEEHIPTLSTTSPSRGCHNKHVASSSVVRVKTTIEGEIYGVVSFTILHRPDGMCPNYIDFNFPASGSLCFWKSHLMNCISFCTFTFHDDIAGDNVRVTRISPSSSLPNGWLSWCTSTLMRERCLHGGFVCPVRDNVLVTARFLMSSLPSELSHSIDDSWCSFHFMYITFRRMMLHLLSTRNMPTHNVPNVTARCIPRISKLFSKSCPGMYRNSPACHVQLKTAATPNAIACTLGRPTFKWYSRRNTWNTWHAYAQNWVTSNPGVATQKGYACGQRVWAARWCSTYVVEAGNRSP